MKSHVENLAKLEKTQIDTYYIINESYESKALKFHVQVNWTIFSFVRKFCMNRRNPSMEYGIKHFFDIPRPQIPRIHAI